MILQLRGPQTQILEKSYYYDLRSFSDLVAELNFCKASTGKLQIFEDLVEKQH